MTSSSLPLPASFTTRKSQILAHLAVPDSEYTDASPKGSVDAGIQELIKEINEQEGWVTTSSCSGRVSVFIDGTKSVGSDSAQQGVEEADAGEEGREDRKASKGLGGNWSFISHDSIDLQNLCAEAGGLMRAVGLLPFESGSGGQSSIKGKRLVRFKFEPMILHVLTASPSHAQRILSAALQAGFRESGAVNLLPHSSKPAEPEPATPIVAVRSVGLGLESVIGIVDPHSLSPVAIVSEEYVRGLFEIANDRFEENQKRIARFWTALLQETGPRKGRKSSEKEQEWEDGTVRRERKRREGLERARVLREVRERDRQTINGGIDGGAG